MEFVYRERLDERIISFLAEKKNLTLEEAMDAYYTSRLANLIQRGVEGIQYLDYKVLVEILCDTEKEHLSRYAK